MRIWIDGDACPGDVKEILFRAATRRKVRATLVANQPMRVPRSEWIDTVLVPSGLNEADQRIVELATPGDLVVTADIPLAAQVVARGAMVINPRGDYYTEANIGARLAERDLLDQLRGEGLITGGPAEYGAKNRQAFANALDQWLTRNRK